MVREQRPSSRGKVPRLNEVLHRYRDPEQRLAVEGGLAEVGDEPVSRLRLAQGTGAGDGNERAERGVRFAYGGEHSLYVLGDRGMTQEKQLPCLANTAADRLVISHGHGGH